MSLQPVLTDDLIHEMLVRRASRASADGLLADVTGAVRVAPRRARTPMPWWRFAPASGFPSLAKVAGFAAAAVAVALVVVAFRPSVGGPGGSTSRPTSAPTASPEPTSAPSAARPTPESIVVGTVTAQRVQLGANAAPIDVAYAFNSIWTADIHANDVRRFDPVTLEEIDRIPVPGGPAWFAVAGGALWVTTQNGLGLTRIDPGSNQVVSTVGDAPPCGAPAVDPATGNLWQAACDGDVFLRINPVTNAVIDTIPASGHAFLVVAGGTLITTGPEGLARLDPVKRTISPIGSAGATNLIFSDGASVWRLDSTAVLRVDPKDGHVLASFPYPGAHAIAFGDGRAWITTEPQGVVEIDLSTNQVLGTIPVPGSQLIPREAGGVLWLTDFDASVLWRMTP